MAALLAAAGARLARRLRAMDGEWPKTVRVIDGPRAGDTVTIVGPCEFPILLRDDEPTPVYDDTSPKPRLSRSTRYWPWVKARETVLSSQPRKIPMEVLERVFPSRD